MRTPYSVALRYGRRDQKIDARGDIFKMKCPPTIDQSSWMTTASPSTKIRELLESFGWPQCLFQQTNTSWTFPRTWSTNCTPALASMLVIVQVCSLPRPRHLKAHHYTAHAKGLLINGCVVSSTRNARRPLSPYPALSRQRKMRPTSRLLHISTIPPHP